MSFIRFSMQQGDRFGIFPCPHKGRSKVGFGRLPMVRRPSERYPQQESQRRSGAGIEESDPHHVAGNGNCRTGNLKI